eukprot:Seg3267.2 transcript_id=Seg3267.2/GoldUCD/mRNA.D3Y31 product="BRCA1-associated protein" protein_id=Seg3267.2/GoldUCD/D3Y31
MPSVALIVLRLEIEDGFLEPKSLNFVADKYFDALQADDGNRTIDPTETEDKKTFLSDDKHLEKQTHRVNRIVSNFTVETYMEKDTTIDSNESTMEEDQSATAKPTQKEESLLPAMSGMKRSRTSPLPFFSGNPMVEHTSGILHLYKDNQMTPLDEDVARSEMICMMSVPAKLTLTDLQQFTQPIKDSIQHMQIIRDNSPNQYMVLLKFKDQRSADGFYKDFNGKPYNMLEPETARLVYVAKMESVKSSEGGYLPVSGLTELPTCPVCLERMDESVEGILTILCNHSFHGACLVQWSDSSCPVCRYSQTPKPVAEQRCFQCDSTESLWICLICGHIGCGRYKDLHAYQHYQQTSHTFSMQLENQRVWDYTGDNYVHRLVQSKSDGKLVAVDGEHEVIDDEKLDSLNLEYTYLLTSQLESQRLYFEEKMTFLEKDAMERRMKKIFDDYEKLEQRVQHSEKEKKTLDKKYTQVVAKVGNLVRDLKEEKEMNSCLSENQKIWQQKFEETSEMMKHLEKTKNQEIADLNEQLRDLMRHLSIQSAVATASDDTQKELQDGQLFVQENQRTSNKTKASPRGKGRATKESLLLSWSMSLKSLEGWCKILVHVSMKEYNGILSVDSDLRR